jgi:hypothetical protein
VKPWGTLEPRLHRFARVPATTVRPQLLPAVCQLFESLEDVLVDPPEVLEALSLLDAGDLLSAGAGLSDEFDPDPPLEPPLFEE